MICDMVSAAVLEQIRSLPRADRKQVAEVLEDSFAADILTPELKADLEARIAAFEADPSRGIPLDVVIAKLERHVA